MTLRSRLVVTLLVGLGWLAGFLMPIQAIQAQGAPVCCLCQRAGTNGSVEARGYFTVDPPSNCSNALSSPIVLGSHQTSEVASISCQVPGASCPNPQPASTMLRTLLPATTAAPAASGQAQASTPTPLPVVTPALSIPIPGLQFGTLAEAGGTTEVPFLSQYIAAVYRYLIGIASLAATIMVVYGGFRYLIGSTGGDVKKGKEIIVDAVAGLVLILGAYAVLNTINSDTLNLKNINLATVQPISLEEMNLDFGTSAGDESVYSQLGSQDPPQSGVSVPGSSENVVAQAGQWRQLATQICGRRDGPTLPYAQQVTRIRDILQRWRQVGVDQGGSIYLRGGWISNCSTNPRFLVNAGNYAHQIPSMLGSVSGAAARLRLTYSPSCQNLVNQFAAQSRPKDPTIFANNEACRYEVADNYNRIVTYARQLGMMCSDCIMTAKYLYSCFGFDAETLGRRVPYITRTCGATVTDPGPDSIYRFKFGLGTDWRHDPVFQQKIGTMRPGDIIIISPVHAAIYSGGASVGLDFEVMEAGCVGGSVRGNRIGTSAPRRSVLGFETDGLCVHRSVRDYLTGVLSAHPNWCVSVLKPLGQ